MKQAWRMSILSGCLGRILTAMWLVVTPPSAYAGWDGCQSSSGWTSGDPGDKSGCSVRYNGNPVAGLGEYEYFDCADPSKNSTCFYDYTTN